MLLRFCIRARCKRPLKTNNLLIPQFTRFTRFTGITPRKDKKRQFCPSVQGLTTFRRCHPDVEPCETEGSAVAFPVRSALSVTSGKPVNQDLSEQWR